MLNSLLPIFAGYMFYKMITINKFLLEALKHRLDKNGVTIYAFVPIASDAQSFFMQYGKVFMLVSLILRNALSPSTSQIHPPCINTRIHFITA